MRIGIPREIKTMEGRVALLPAACGELVRAGHEVFVEAGAGAASGYNDAAYQAQGVHLAADPAQLYTSAELIVKVKEPQPSEWPLLGSQHLLFCFLHLAAETALTQALQQIGLTAVGFETLRADHELPLLAPMSYIAGNLAVQIGAHLLHRPQGGKGLMLGGLACSERGRVVVLGAGTAGQAAARAAAALGARVWVSDKRPERLAALHAAASNISTFYPYAESVREQVARADLLVGAVLVPGARAPMLVDEATVRDMQDGSVIVDISVDQGGCVATTRPTTYADPTYQRHGVTHFAVTNMPGAVPRTATQALSAALLPYVQRLARPDWRQNPALAEAVNVAAGERVLAALL